MASITPQDNFLGKLRKIFSSNSAIVNIGGNKLKVIDFNQHQLKNIPNNFQVYDYERYGRLYSTLPASLMNSGQAFNYQLAKIELFKAYEDMDRDSILASILDIYSEESSLRNEYGETLKIMSPNSNVQDVLYNLFYDVMNIEFNLSTWIRNLCKYGDFYLKLNLTKDHGIVNIMPMSPYSVVRIENIYDPNSEIQFMYDPMFGINNSAFGSKIQTFDEYEVAHFRNITDSNFMPYGRSILEPARKTWEQLVMMIDAMLINRVMRAPAKRIFKIDIGNIPPHEVDNFMEKTINKLKKVPYMDQNTGNYNLKFNLQNMLEDFYMPVRGSNSGTAIENIEGIEFNGIEDIEFLRNYMLAALKVPKAFIGYEGGVEGKATLAAEDLRFARTIEKLQRIIESELYKMAIIHLYIQGFRGSDLVDFKLKLTTASTIYQREKIELWKSKIELVRDIRESKLLSKSWIYEQVFEIDSDDWKSMQSEIITDAKFDYRIEKISQDGADPKDVAMKGKEDTMNDEGENSWDMIDNTNDDNNKKKDNKKDTDKSIESEISQYDDIFKDPFKDKTEDKYELDTRIHHTFHGNSPLSTENSIIDIDKLLKKLNENFKELKTDKYIIEDVILKKRFNNKKKLIELIQK